MDRENELWNEYLKTRPYYSNNQMLTMEQLNAQIAESQSFQESFAQAANA